MSETTTANISTKSNISTYHAFLKHRQWVQENMPLAADKPERNDIPEAPSPDRGGGGSSKPEDTLTQQQVENGWVNVGLFSLHPQQTEFGYNDEARGLSIAAGTEYTSIHLRRVDPELFTLGAIRESLAAASDYMKVTEVSPDSLIGSDTYAKLGKLAGRMGVQVIDVDLPPNLVPEDPALNPVIVYSTVADFHDLFGRQ
jgi:hypothetical protein